MMSEGLRQTPSSDEIRIGLKDNLFRRNNSSIEENVEMVFRPVGTLENKMNRIVIVQVSDTTKA